MLLSLHAQLNNLKDTAMTLCPIAALSSCTKCPAFKICPAKSLLGDQAKPADKSKPDTGDSK